MQVRIALSTMVLCLSLPAGITFARQSKSSTPKRPTTGTLVVSMGLAMRGTEGYVAYFLVRSSGSRVEEKSMVPDASVSFSLPPGQHYELLGYLRDCHANCSNLGLPVDECGAPFTLKAGETLYVKRLRVTIRGKVSCKLTFSSSPLP